MKEGGGRVHVELQTKQGKSILNQDTWNCVCVFKNSMSTISSGETERSQQKSAMPKNHAGSEIG